MLKRKRFALIALAISTVLVGSLAVAQSSDQVIDNAPDVRTRQKAWLGVRVADIPPMLSAHLPDLKEGGGVMVEQVVDASPALAAGLKPFDVITGINDLAVNSPTQLIEQVGKAKPGDHVTIEYLRNGQEFSVELTLAESRFDVATTFSDQTMPVPPVIRSRPFAFVPFGPPMIWPDRSFYTLDVPDLDWNQANSFQSKSIQIIQNGDGQLTIDLEYQDNGDSIKRKYEGSRDQVLESIRSDQELPESLRKSIENSLSRSVARVDFDGHLLNFETGLPGFLLQFSNQPWISGSSQTVPRSLLRPGLVDERALESIK